MAVSRSGEIPSQVWKPAGGTAVKEASVGQFEDSGALQSPNGYPALLDAETRSISVLTPPAPGQPRPMWPRSSCRH